VVYAVVTGIAVTLPVSLGRAGFLGASNALVAGEAVCLAIAGLSLNLLMGYAGQVSLGHFALLGTGAFVSARLTAPTPSDPVGAPFVVGVAAAVAAGAATAFVLGLPALRLRGIHLAIVTVLFNFVMVDSLFQSPWLSSGSGGVELPRPVVGGFRFVRNGDYLAVLAGALVVVWLLDANLRSSRVGRAWNALRADEDMAASFGIHVSRQKLAAFTVSGAVAGLAGALLGHLFTFVNSATFDLRQSLLLLAITVLGGLGSRAGVVAAAAVYATADTVLENVFGSGAGGWILVASGVLVMLTISRHPGGLAGAWREAVERRRPAPRARRPGVVPAVPAAGHPRPASASREPGAAAGPLLRVEDLTVRYEGVVAVDRASLEVRGERIVGLIGPNGAGKTSLFNAVAGALRPEGGRVLLDGLDVTGWPAHRRAAGGIGRSFQLIGLAKDLSVTENLLLAQHLSARYGFVWALAGVGPAARVEAQLRRRADEVLATLGFEGLGDVPVGRLSHGQQRIVEIACVLMSEPQLVMLDEPSAGMAPNMVEHLAGRLRDIRDRLGRSVLVIEHNIPLVLAVCDEVYVMAEGRVIAHGEPGAVVSRPEVVAAYLGGSMDP
jgi:ABC-type branched-subunit amino acid transport system ATPase component/ABC-type branched-subunit amino acid transport system permease subunit